jgi:hypothetical protein
MCGVCCKALLLSATFCLVHMNCCIFLCVRKNTAIIMLKMIGATIQDLVAEDLWNPAISCI